MIVSIGVLENQCLKIKKSLCSRDYCDINMPTKMLDALLLLRPVVQPEWLSVQW